MLIASSILERWSLREQRLEYAHPQKTFFWDMPAGFRMPSASLLSLAEYLLLTPHGESVELAPMVDRQPGKRVAVAYSGGVDSTAALHLLPDPIPIHTLVARPKGMHKTENALLAVKEVGGHAIPSNWDELPLLYGRSSGSYGMGAWTITAVLLADHFDINCVADGNIVDFIYLAGPGGHGTRFNPHDAEGLLAPFRTAGLEYCMPIAGLSEVSTTRIAGQVLYAMGCMRGEGGQPCHHCMKCYRKEALKGAPIASNPDVERILARDPIPVLGVLLWATQNRGLQHPRLEPFQSKGIDWVDKWYPRAIEYIPLSLRPYFLEQLERFGIDTLADTASLESWDAASGTLDSSGASDV